MKDDLVEITADVLLKGLEEAVQQMQDMSILYRKDKYLTYALQTIALSGARDFITSLYQRGVKFYAPADVAKEIGVNVGS